MKNKTFTSNKLRFHRERAGLTQKDVAESLGLDCRDRISRWENGVTMPSITNLCRLAEIYKVIPQELYPELTQNEQDQ